nr:13057_t:CDS:2 [Entrophospora candida]
MLNCNPTPRSNHLVPNLVLNTTVEYDLLIGVANDFDDADDMAIGFVVGYGEYGEYGDVTPTDYWEEDDNDCGHEYSCTNSKLHPYNNLCELN